MKKLLPFGLDKYEYFTFKETTKELDFFLLNGINTGNRVSETWNIPSLNKSQEGEYSNIKNFKVSLLDEKAKQVLDFYLGDKVEFLPVLFEKEKYYILNVINYKSLTLKEAKEQQSELEKEDIVAINQDTILLSNNLEKIILENKISNLYTVDIFEDKYFKMFSQIELI